MVTPGHGEEEEDEEEEDDDRLASWKSLCSWSFTMLFMALCISANILCFSRFGIRPKRTAVDRRGRGGVRPDSECAGVQVGVQVKAGAHRRGSCPQTDTS